MYFSVTMVRKRSVSHLLLQISCCLLTFSHYVVPIFSALRWIRLARDVLESKFRMRSETFREDLDGLLGQMPEEDDW